LKSQDTSPLLLNKFTRAPSDIVIGQTRSANSSHDLPKCDAFIFNIFKRKL